MRKYIFLICFFNDNFINNFFYFPIVVTSESLPLLLLQVLSWQQYYHTEKKKYDDTNVFKIQFVFNLKTYIIEIISIQF